MVSNEVRRTALSQSLIVLLLLCTVDACLSSRQISLFRQRFLQLARKSACALGEASTHPAGAHDILNILAVRLHRRERGALFSRRPECPHGCTLARMELCLSLVLHGIKARRAPRSQRQLSFSASPRRAQAAFMQEKQQANGASGRQRLGFTFSFPCLQTALDAGSLICWTKARTSWRPAVPRRSQACQQSSPDSAQALTGRAPPTRGCAVQGFNCTDGPGLDVCELLKRELQSRRACLPL